MTELPLGEKWVARYKEKREMSCITKLLEMKGNKEFLPCHYVEIF
jgi:hypothetical protein